MNITFDELRQIKHQLPTGSVGRIAKELNLDEQTVRNYFGAAKFEDGKTVGNHVQPGPNGGIVSIEDTTILELARKIIREAQDN
ncbi:MAG: DNA-binding protein [Saprospiraceae bacterium]|jgi:predicted transcriptional regulator|nr:DNA-binding protein [Saprospiraceae bacterium]MBP6396788.1 DNA-binding protein [Saprospiraceae bacterium]MBP9193399.1 DNA-binding protein [Saprospiraceae bacterium]